MSRGNGFACNRPNLRYIIVPQSHHNGYREKISHWSSKIGTTVNSKCSLYVKITTADFFQSPSFIVTRNHKIPYYLIPETLALALLFILNTCAFWGQKTWLRKSGYILQNVFKTGEFVNLSLHYTCKLQTAPPCHVILGLISISTKREIISRTST